MRDVVLGPILSLGSRELYRRVARRPLSHGLAYLGWLSFLFSSIVMAVVVAVWLPAADQLAAWLAARLPEMRVTPDGVVTEGPEPVVLTHPELGTLLVVDTSKEFPTDSELEGTLVFVGRRHLTVANRQRGERRVVDLTRTNGGRWVGTTVNGRLVHDVYGSLRAFAGPVIFALCLALFFAWKLAAALSYSLVGVVLNRFRRERLGYASILNVTLFAMTMVCVLQGLALLGGLGPFRVTGLAGWVITGSYLAFALLRREPRPDASPVPS